MEILRKISFYLEKISGYLDRIFNSIGIILYSSLVVLVFIGTVSRYTLDYPFSFTEELATMLMIAMGLLSVANPFKREEHPKLILIVERFPKQVQKIIYVFINLFCIYIILRLIPHSFALIWTIGKGQRLATLDISMAFFYMPLGLGLSFLLLEFINLSIKKIIKNGSS